MQTKNQTTTTAAPAASMYVSDSLPGYPATPATPRIGRTAREVAIAYRSVAMATNNLNYAEAHGAPCGVAYYRRRLSDAESYLSDAQTAYATACQEAR